MNGWLKAAPTLVRLSRCYSGRFRTSILLHRRDFAVQSHGTHLSDILSNSARLRDANEPPFIRRGVAVTNLPPGTTAQQLLDLVRTGALEYAKLNKDGTRVDLSFIHGYSAARFILAPPTLLGNKLRCAWLPYRPLDPVVAVAFERDRARRTLLLCKKHEREGTWAARRLQRYLKGVLEHVTVHEVRDPKLKGVYREVAEARFCDIASAIRAHARLRADPFMMSVHIAYGADPCEFPSPSPSSDSDYFEALTAEPRHLPSTYFPITTSASSSGTQTDTDMDAIYRPFTTLTLSNLPARTTVRDLCKRVFGGPVWAVEVDDERCSAVRSLLHSLSPSLYLSATLPLLFPAPSEFEPLLTPHAGRNIFPPRARA
ncbi:hypothetical protein B0H14DRAFT_890866 [Mycena olivaceomarginata]|nr:hypothetical protein B0H14DRAFT_890866 [Mycena olivaceomarginata]